MKWNMKNSLHALRLVSRYHYIHGISQLIGFTPCLHLYHHNHSPVQLTIKFIDLFITIKLLITYIYSYYPKIVLQIRYLRFLHFKFPHSITMCSINHLSFLLLFIFRFDLFSSNYLRLVCANKSYPFVRFIELRVYSK